MADQRSKCLDDSDNVYDDGHSLIRSGFPASMPVADFFMQVIGILQAFIFIMITMCDMAFNWLLSNRPRFRTSSHVTAQSHGQYSQSTGRDQSCDEECLKSFMEMPGPRGWPVLGCFPEYFKTENQGQIHLMMKRWHSQYGKIFKEQFGSSYNVLIADPELIEEVMRKEGKFPLRPPYESWLVYNRMRSRTGGLMTSQEESWRINRSVMAPRLRPRAVGEYVGVINEVCADLVDRITHLRQEHGDGMVAHLPFELNKFSMETVFYVTLNRRVGCLDRHLLPEVDSFLKSLSTMFLTGHQLMIYAKLHKLLRTRPWREHAQALDQIYSFAGKHINERIDELLPELESGAAASANRGVDFLAYVLGTHKLSREQIVDNVTEMLLAGLDTTGVAISFLLYLLSTNLEVQSRLVEEVDNVVGERIPDNNDLHRMPYLKACVKETLRLFPPIPINARTTTEDVSIGGYHIPKDTILMLNYYVMSHDEKNFSQPEEFIPERWLSDDHSSTGHPFAHVPFSIGTRSCIGRRLAEVQIYIATIQILQKYSLTKSDKFDIRPSVRTQLTPGPELPVIFTERS